MKLKFLWMAAAAIVLAGCGNTIKVTFVAEEQKMILNPSQGDVIKWTRPNGDPMPIRIIPPTPPFCKEDPSSGQCTVAVNNTRVLYTCDQCTDPEIEVGSSIGTLGGGKTLATARTPPTSITYLYCDGDNAVIQPPTVTYKQTAVTGGVSNLWRSLGSGPPDWTVDTFSNPICQEASPFNKANPVCDLKTDATAPATTYRATVTGCKNPATGTINITP